MWFQRVVTSFQEAWGLWELIAASVSLEVEALLEVQTWNQVGVPPPAADPWGKDPVWPLEMNAVPGTTADVP